MHRHTGLLILAGLVMTASLNAQTVPPQPAAPQTATPQTAPPPPTARPAAAPPSSRTPPAARVATTPPSAAPSRVDAPMAAQAPPRVDMPVAAQTARPAQAPPSAPRPGSAATTVPPSPAAIRRGDDASQNVRVDLRITDGTAVKVVTMLVADGHGGRIRSSNDVQVSDRTGALSYRQILINIDAIPTVRSDGRVQLTLTVEYTPDLPQTAASTPRPASVNESLTVLVTDGKSTLISQSADPATDRKVTVEVTATVVK